MKRKRDNDEDSAVEKICALDIAGPNIMRLRSRPVRHDCISKFRSDLEDIVQIPAINKIVDLWESFDKAPYTIINHPEIKDCLSKLYVITCRAILFGKLSPEKEENLRLRLRSRLNNFAERFGITNNQQFGSYCHQLACLLNVNNPWDLDYIVVFQYQLIATEDQASALWEKENEIMIRIRIEYLILLRHKLKKNDPLKWNALTFAHTAYLMNTKVVDGGQKAKYDAFINIFYLLLCHQLKHSSSTNDSNILMNLLNIKEAVSIVKRLETDDNNKRIYCKWREWEHACKIIMVQVINSLFQMNGEKKMDSRVVKDVLLYWVKHVCSVSDHEAGCLSGVKRLVLSKIFNMDTEYFYVLADVIWSNHLKLQLEPLLRDNTVVFISVMAMTEDYNKIRTQDDSRFESVDEGYSNKCSNEMKQKLSKRYFKLADRFRDDKKINFHLCLTAFSLDPSSSTYSRLVQEYKLRFSNEKSRYIKETGNSIDLDSKLTIKDDLWNVILMARRGILKQHVDEEKVPDVCLNILKTGGPREPTKSDLHDLHTDWTQYTPPEYDDEDEGFEKGYEPEPFPIIEQNNNKIGSKKQNRKRTKSSSTTNSYDNDIEKEKDLSSPVLNIEGNIPPFSNYNNSNESPPKTTTINNRFVPERFLPNIPINRIFLTNSAKPCTENHSVPAHVEGLPADTEFILVPATEVSSGVMEILGLTINKESIVLNDGDDLCAKELAVITNEVVTKLSSSLQKPHLEIESSSLPTLLQQSSEDQRKKVVQSYNFRNKKLQKHHINHENQNRQPLKGLKNELNITQNHQSATNESLGKRKRQFQRITCKVQKIT